MPRKRKSECRLEGWDGGQFRIMRGVKKGGREQSGKYALVSRKIHKAVNVAFNDTSFVY